MGTPVSARKRSFAPQRIVVDAQDGDVLRDAKPREPAGAKNFPRLDIVGAEDRERPRLCREPRRKMAVAGRQIAPGRRAVDGADQPSGRQFAAECLPPLVRPGPGTRGLHEGVVLEAPFAKVFGGQPRDGSGVEAQLHRPASGWRLSVYAAEAVTGPYVRVANPGVDRDGSVRTFTITVSDVEDAQFVVILAAGSENLLPAQFDDPSQFD